MASFCFFLLVISLFYSQYQQAQVKISKGSIIVSKYNMGENGANNKGPVGDDSDASGSVVNRTGGNGGSGIVIIHYPLSNLNP